VNRRSRVGIAHLSTPKERESWTLLELSFGIALSLSLYFNAIIPLHARAGASVPPRRVIGSRDDARDKPPWSSVVTLRGDIVTHRDITRKSAGPFSFAKTRTAESAAAIRRETGEDPNGRTAERPNGRSQEDDGGGGRGERDREREGEDKIVWSQAG